MYITMCHINLHDTLNYKLQFTLFIATVHVLTNKLVILTILLLQSTPIKPALEILLNNFLS